MRARVVFESMFGNTQVIAQAVADGLAESMNVDVEEVGSAATEIAGDVELLVVGGPTHAFGLSRERTRESAAEQAVGGVVSPGEGLREWLSAVTGGSRAIAAAAFDTRIDKPRMPGSAAHGAEKRLRRMGFHCSSEPQASMSQALRAHSWTVSVNAPAGGASFSVRRWRLQGSIDPRPEGVNSRRAGATSWIVFCGSA
jgi:hypothetical protein